METVTCEELFGEYKKAWIGKIECDHEKQVVTFGNKQCIITDDNADLIQQKYLELKHNNLNRFFMLVFQIKTTSCGHSWAYSREYVWSNL